jgi:hypothetical protein
MDRRARIRNRSRQRLDRRHLIAQVDTSTAIQEGYQSVLFSAAGLTPGTHTLTIDVVGGKNQPPGATVERAVIDAFDVY